MLRNKEVLTAVGTLVCAMGIGFVMQSSDVAEKRYGTSKATVIAGATPKPTTNVAQAAMLEVKEITLTSAAFDADVTSPTKAIPVEAIFEPADTPEALSELPEAVTDQTCEVAAVARATMAAMVNLTLEAPCMQNERLTVHHNGMVFSETTSETGSLSLQVPALSQEAVFIIAFSSGEGAVARTTVEELANYDRAVLQWKGDAGFQIHAREFGADYGTIGHRWADDPGKLTNVASGASGVVTHHGETDLTAPLLAEVYTFPRGTNGQSGDVILTVEAEVTDSNCGLEVEAQSLELQPDGQVRTRNVILPVPACDSVGSFLVLNNLLQDLKVAAR